MRLRTPTVCLRPLGWRTQRRIRTTLGVSSSPGWRRKECEVCMGLSPKKPHSGCGLGPGSFRVRKSYPNFWTYYCKLTAHGWSTTMPNGWPGRRSNFVKKKKLLRSARRERMRRRNLRMRSKCWRRSIRKETGSSGSGGWIWYQIQEAEERSSQDQGGASQLRLCPQGQRPGQAEQHLQQQIHLHLPPSQTIPFMFRWVMPGQRCNLYDTATHLCPQCGLRRLRWEVFNLRRNLRWLRCTNLHLLSPQ